MRQAQPYNLAGLVSSKLIIKNLISRMSHFLLVEKINTKQY